MGSENNGNVINLRLRSLDFDKRNMLEDMIDAIEDLEGMKKLLRYISKTKIILAVGTDLVSTIQNDLLPSLEEATSKLYITIVQVESALHKATHGEPFSYDDLKR